ncbi:condensation domain-containing protein [Neocallimastix lanati (nom. inval.)]|nr:condensation domain-containing protein [Neocallimastix sp. JGI-2020a]
MDHRIADGYSFGILIKELFTIYTNETLPELLIQYTDYAIDYDKRLKSGNINSKINFYKSIFNNIPQEEMNLSLKFKENKNKLQENNGYKLITVDTDSEVFDIINKIAKEHNLSKTAIFLTVYSLVLSLYSGKKNIFNAVISSSRMNKDTEGMIGLFARYIPTLVKFDQQSSLIETIKTCMDTLLTMFNDDIPFTIISEELNLPTCQSWFKFDPYTMMNNDTISFGKSVTCNEVYDQFNCEYLKPNNEISSLNALDYLTLENSPDFIYTLSEKKDYYTIEFLYKNEKYKECFIQEIIFNFFAIIKNVENFNVDLSSKDITLKANLIKYYDYDNQKIDENSTKITNTTIKNDINNNNKKLVLDNFHNNNATKNTNNQGTNELNNTKSLNYDKNKHINEKHNYDKNKNINKNNNKFKKFIEKFQKIFM